MHQHAVAESGTGHAPEPRVRTARTCASSEFQTWNQQPRQPCAKHTRTSANQTSSSLRLLMVSRTASAHRTPRLAPARSGRVRQRTPTRIACARTVFARGTNTALAVAAAARVSACMTATPSTSAVGYSGTSWFLAVTQWSKHVFPAYPHLVRVGGGATESG